MVWLERAPEILMLLDLLTIFFLVAGGLLLWLNLRQRCSRDIILTKFDDDRPDD